MLFGDLVTSSSSDSSSALQDGCCTSFQAFTALSLSASDLASHFTENIKANGKRTLTSPVPSSPGPVLLPVTGPLPVLSTGPVPSHRGRLPAVSPALPRGHSRHSTHRPACLLLALPLSQPRLISPFPHARCLHSPSASSPLMHFQPDFGPRHSQEAFLNVP